MADPDATFEFPSLLFPELVSAPAAASPGLPILPLGNSSPPTPKEIRRTRSRPPPETSPGTVNGSAGLTKPEYRRLRSKSSERLDAQARPTHLHSPCPCVLGPARVLPATMELSDIRSRQRRRPAGEASRRVGWMVLRSLSCNGIESAAAATAPLGVVVRLRGSWKNSCV